MLCDSQLCDGATDHWPRRGKTGCSLRGCLHFEVPCEVNMAAERVDNGKVAAPIPLGMPVIEECPLMIGSKLAANCLHPSV